MTAFPPIEAIRDRFPTHRSDLSSSALEKLEHFSGSALRVPRSAAVGHFDEDTFRRYRPG
jgi:hypothetical protein